MPNDELNFLSFLQTFRRGELVAEADNLLAELVEAIRTNGGKGNISINLPLKMNDAGQIECVPQLSMKKPRKPIGTGIYFATDDGRLSRRDPNQMDLLDEITPRRSGSDH